VTVYLINRRFSQRPIAVDDFPPVIIFQPQFSFQIVSPECESDYKQGLPFYRSVVQQDLSFRIFYDFLIERIASRNSCSYSSAISNVMSIYISIPVLSELIIKT